MDFMVLKSTSLQTGNMFDFGKSMREILRVDDPTQSNILRPRLNTGKYKNCRRYTHTHTHRHTPHTHQQTRGNITTNIYPDK